MGFSAATADTLCALGQTIAWLAILLNIKGLSFILAEGFFKVEASAESLLWPLHSKKDVTELEEGQIPE